MKYYLDCEFDGHDGDLISMALVNIHDSIYIKVADAIVGDRWVAGNVIPVLDSHLAPKVINVNTNDVGAVLRAFLPTVDFEIVADSPVDIYRFCKALSTGPDGGWESTGYRQIKFTVENIDCYPTSLTEAVQHNAWWDATALAVKFL